MSKRQGLRKEKSSAIFCRLLSDGDKSNTFRCLLTIQAKSPPRQRSTNRVKFGSLRTLCSEINRLPETSYTLPVWTDTRTRHYHRTQGQRVVELVVVQLEVEV